MIRPAETGVVMMGLLIASANSAFAETFNLVCYGAGYAPNVTTNPTFFFDNQGNSFVLNSMRVGKDNFQDIMRISIDGDGGAAMPPSAIVPPINLGGKDGWWKLKRVTVTDQTITASFDFNIVNHPKLVIDRLTGGIQMKGFKLGFSGQCENFDPNTTPKKF